LLTAALGALRHPAEGIGAPVATSDVWLARTDAPAEAKVTVALLAPIRIPTRIAGAARRIECRE
jgi:hypothetical protein